MTNMEKFTQQISRAGMTKHKVDIPPETLLKIELYLDIEGPFNEEFRKCSSIFALATEEELEAGLERWRGEIERGNAFAKLER